MLIHSNVV